jgi:hypothetical protein
MKKIKFFTALMVIAIGFAACTSDSMEEVNKEASIDAKILAKIAAAGLSADDVFVDTFMGKEGFVIEGDIFLTLKQINKLEPSSKHYRSNNIVGPDGRVVTVYMDANFNATMQAAFDDALNRYNSLGLDITFTRATSQGADIDVLSEKIKKYRGSTILGRSAGFPDVNGDPATPIVLNSDVYDPRRGGVPADAATVIAHEIGHAIGFRHTDYFNRSFSCGRGGDEGDGGIGAIYIPGTPSGAENGSWMLACSNGTDRPFTSGDVTALLEVY